MSAVVIGLDTDSFGFHWVSNMTLWDGNLKYPDSRTVVGSAIGRGDNAEDRRAFIFLAACQFFSQFADEAMPELHVFCEEPLVLTKNIVTTRKLNLVAGAIWGAFAGESGFSKNSWFWHWVDVAHWKKEVVGKGNASKQDIWDFCHDNPAWQHLARLRPDAEKNPDGPTYGEIFAMDNNLYDAWCLSVYGRRQLALLDRG